MSNWIMSIVGAICLSALADVVMDEGETKKYVKCVMAIIILAVIISPLPKLLSADLDLMDLIATETVLTTENSKFLYDIKEKQLKNQTNSCVKALEEKGYSSISITPVLSYGNSLEILEIVIDKTQIVISDSVSNININEELKSIVSSHFGINENAVRIVG